AAIANYIALLGWRPEGGEELFTIERMSRGFRLEALSRVPATYDPRKLAWVARQHMRKIAPEDLAGMVRPYLRDAAIDPEIARARIGELMTVVREEVQSLSEAAEHCRPFLLREVIYDGDALQVLRSSSARSVLSESSACVEMLDGGEEGARRFISELQRRTGLRGKELYMPLRAALTGKMSGPEVAALLRFLDRERVRARLRAALDRGAASVSHT
ncbi:MAG: hypothetical protein NT045_00825, partial [Candidatus Aureabacteria bacterium]|nr:hypothetical protein [Candidatus Auribacterota bacterium]